MGAYHPDLYGFEVPESKELLVDIVVDIAARTKRGGCYQIHRMPDGKIHVFWNLAMTLKELVQAIDDAKEVYIANGHSVSEHSWVAEIQESEEFKDIVKIRCPVQSRLLTDEETILLQRVLATDFPQNIEPNSGRDGGAVLITLYRNGKKESYFNWIIFRQEYGLLCFLVSMIAENCGLGDIHDPWVARSVREGDTIYSYKMTLEEFDALHC